MTINGWFLRLCYGNHTQASCCVSHIELNTMLVPVNVDNEHTNTTRTSYLFGGFHGVDSHDGRHKPVMSFLIVDDQTTLRRLDDDLCK